MANPERKALIIPDESELQLAMQGMMGRVQRAAQRGEVAENFGDIGYENANRLLAEADHLREHLIATSHRVELIVASGQISTREAYLAGAKDILEILLTATTNFELPPDPQGV